MDKNSPPTPLNLPEIVARVRELDAKRSESPWSTYGSLSCNIQYGPVDGFYGEHIACADSPEDAAFIAHAPQTAQALLAYAELCEKLVGGIECARKSLELEEDTLADVILHDALSQATALGVKVV